MLQCDDTMPLHFNVMFKCLVRSWSPLCRAQKAVAEEGAADKQLKTEAKEVWKLLKKFKVTPANLSLSQEELRQKVESIPSREPPVNGKLAAEISDKWKIYAERCAAKSTQSTASVCH